MRWSSRRASSGFLAALCLALTVYSATVAQAEEPSIGGVYELAMGTRDPLPLIEYWQQFGYRVGRIGELDAEAAERLYGVPSALRSIRLLHQDADHGLLRILVWEEPAGEGLGLAPMKVLGGRWGAMVTRDVYNIVNHAEDAAAAGLPVLFVPPQRQVIYGGGGRHRPFLDPALCVREMLLVQPQTRQILFQRYGYELPLYGKIHEEAPMRVSQVTHAGLIVQGEASLIDFYEEALGLLRARDGHRSDDSDPASKNIFDLQPGESYVSTDFDDPRSDPSDLSKVRSGRLKVIRFPAGLDIPDLRHLSRPGQLGLSVYSYRVRGLEHYRGQVQQHGATEVSSITANEFGERSFTFIAPDGNAWILLEQ